MRRTKFLMCIFMAASLFVTSFASCNNSTQNSQNTENTQSTQADSSGNANTTDSLSTTSSDKKDEQIANLDIVSEPGTLDPSLAADNASYMVISNIMASLTKNVFDGEKEVAKENGAEKIDVSSDGLVWTFHIRDMKWSDGVKIKAQDYEYSLMRTLDPRTASTYSFLLFPIKGAEEYNLADPTNEAAFEEARKNIGIVAKDDSTLEITLKAPCAYFKQTTYFMVYSPQRQDFVEKYGNTFGVDADKLLYNGPYKIKEWKHKDTIVLEKNQDYWDKDNYPLETVNLRIIQDPETDYAELEAGGLDAYAGVSKLEWDDKFKTRDDMENFKQMRADVVYFLFNENEKYSSIFKNLKLRQAVSAALDREEAVEQLFGGIAAIPAYDFCYDAFVLEPNLPYRTTAGEEPIKRLQKMVTDPKAHFIEGMKELGLGDDPSKVTFKLYTLLNYNAFAEYFQAQLQEALGCKIELDVSESAQYQQKRNNYEYDLGLQAWMADYNDPMTMFDFYMSNTEQSATGMKNEEYDNLIKQAGALPTEKNKERIELFSKAENILLVDECAAAPWAHRQRNGYKYKYLQNYRPSIFGALDLMKVKIEGK